MATRDEQIRLIAYQIWEEEGRPQGKQLEHWTQAEWRLNQMDRPGSDDGGRAAVAGRPAAPVIRRSIPEPTLGARPAPRAAANSPAGDKKVEQTRPPRTRRPER